jgi:hypothetical protein
VAELGQMSDGNMAEAEQCNAILKLYLECNKEESVPEIRWQKNL